MILTQLTNISNQSFISLLKLIPRYCIYFLLIFTPLARGSVQSWAITTIHIITLIALTAFLLEKTLNWDWKWIKTPFDKPILALLALCGISAFFSIHRQTSFWAMILLINYIIIFYLIIHTIITKNQLLKLFYIIIGVATFLTLFGLFKRIGVNPFPWWHYPEIKSEAYRLSSTFGNANHLAGYMEMTLLLILGLLLSGFKRINRLAFVGFITLFMVAIALSLSRGGWISTLVGLFFMVFILFSNRVSTKRLLIPPFVVGLLVVTLVVLSYTPTVKRVGPIDEFGQTTNFRARITVWSGIVEMIKDRPVLGTGPGTFANAFTRYQPPGHPNRYFYAHNDYLHIISEIGLPVIIILIWMIVIFYKTGFKKVTNQNSLEKGIALGAMAGITSILIHSIVDFNLHIPANAIFFSSFIAIFVTSYRENDNQLEEK